MTGHSDSIVIRGAYVLTFDHTDAGTLPRQVIGDRTANDATADDDNIGGREWRQARTATTPVGGLDGIACSLIGMRPAR